MLEAITPNNDGLCAGSDSESIQNAVNFAHCSGMNEVVIPRYNKRTDSMQWIIDKTILLPSDMTVTLDGCHLRMADGAVCNMFCNANARTDVGNTDAGRQHDIRIIGAKNAVLDGGEPNALNEFTSRKNGLPHCSHNLTVYLHNVENFEISGFTILNQRWWAMAFMFAHGGRIADLHFRLTRHETDTYGVWRNQDGIDLRIGCSNILIENIEGETGDDFIALTALYADNFEKKETVENAERAIHDVIIRNIRAVTSMCAMVRLLSHFGQKIYNISMDNLFDISRRGKEAQTQMTLRIGDDAHGYYRSDENRIQPGDIENITVSNVFSRALCGVNICTAVRNMSVRNLHMYGDGGYAVFIGFAGGRSPLTNIFLYHPSRQGEYDSFEFLPCHSPHETEVENILIENIVQETGGQKSKAVVGVSEAKISNVKIRGVCNETALPLLWCNEDSAEGQKIEFR